MTRLFTTSARPGPSDPDWMTARRHFDEEFRTHSPFLTSDVFDEAFVLTACDPNPPAFPSAVTRLLGDPTRLRAEQTKAMSLMLVLDKNRGFINFIAPRAHSRRADLKEDVVQSAFARLQNETDGVSVADRLTEWALAHAHPDAKERTRSRQRLSRRWTNAVRKQIYLDRTLNMRDDVLPFVPDLSAVVYDGEYDEERLMRNMKEEFDCLTDRDKKIIQLERQQFTYREISQWIQDVSIPTVCRIVNRFLERVRERYRNGATE